MLNRLPSPSAVTVDCLRPVEMAGSSAITALWICAGVSLNSRPSIDIASPPCALSRISYRLFIAQAPCWRVPRRSAARTHLGFLDQADNEQQNHGTDDGVDNRCDDAAADSNPDQRQ